MRPRKLVSLFALACFIGLTVLILRRNEQFDAVILTGHYAHEENEPLLPPHSLSHPIHQLISNATSAFRTRQARQSRSLSDAVAEYRRRYEMPPPPHFDKWYEFARERGVEIIDEYDAIYHSLLPFWALEPAVIRERTREALGFINNAMIGVYIRNGNIVNIQGGGNGAEWHREATKSMLDGFVQFLPNMDLAFNVHDEPRVVLQHDDLSHHVRVAKDVNMPIAYANRGLSNKWSPPAADLGDGIRIKEYRTSRFNRFAHQSTWSNSRMSCPPESPARDLLNDTAADNTTSFAIHALGFIHNTTAFSDICNSPSLRRSFGFFDRSNAFDITHDLFPVFSQSKVSSFQDILYPSPWYWAGRVTYNDEEDVDWAAKFNKLYWRGSTTGGFSRNGGWRRHHRQQFVQKANSLEPATLLNHTTGGEDGEWVAVSVPHTAVRDFFDVKFTFVGQCDPGDCAAQREFFELAPHAEQSDAFRYKYLLDVDGNAFSGRYYSFLLSKSLVFKVALFREWHDEWLTPWVHYVPLSMKGAEYAEVVRYFDREASGKVQARKIADRSRAWAKAVLRKEDMEVWYFRLLLE